MKLRTRMFVMLAPLVTLLVVFVSIEILNKYNVMRVPQTVQGATLELEAIADLVHALQLERGYSAGFIGSDGENFSEDVLRQRLLVDQMASIFDR